MKIIYFIYSFKNVVILLNITFHISNYSDYRFLIFTILNFSICITFGPQQIK